jgi:hypothetical protein
VHGFLPAAAPVGMRDVRSLYSEDPELFYQLAIGDLPSTSPSDAKGMSALIRTIAVMVRDGFTIDSRVGTPVAVGNDGGILPLEDADSDESFLQAIFVEGGGEKSLAGSNVSDSSVSFHLDHFPWEQQVRQTELLRLAPEDAASATRGLPPHQFYELVDCAREVVRAPLCVWEGIRDEHDDSPWGRAYCGKPSRQWTNDGQPRTPPEGYVYVVYTDPDGFVFDWDWVESDPNEPSFPKGYADRFERRRDNSVRGELLIGNLATQCQPFSPAQGFYSSRGDCVFFYFNQQPSYARRIHEYLTAYFAFDPISADNPSIGFKLKYVSRLLAVLHKYKKKDDEKIQLSFDATSVGIDILFLMRAWLHEGWPRAKSLEEGMILLKQLEQLDRREVRLPRELYRAA